MMTYLLPKLRILLDDLKPLKEKLWAQKKVYLISLLLNLIIITGIFSPVLSSIKAAQTSLTPLSPLPKIQRQESKDQKEVFGFAPFWTLDKMQGIDWSTLTTLAYFDVKVQENGVLDRQDYGYQSFRSAKATALFKRAHSQGTRVVLTVTQMQSSQILALLDSPNAQNIAISQIVNEVQGRGIDGVNVDFEMDGDPGVGYRNKFTQFVANLTNEMHRQNPDSKVTVSVYAASAKQPKLYNIGGLAQASDGIFMMAYDFGASTSGEAWPTAPLYGASNGTYWYDVSTAVDDFLAQMPAEKLILGVPWYGYNYAVASPSIKATTYRYSSVAQPYAWAKDSVGPDMPGVLGYQEGWDNAGQVGWKAYLTANDGWRMIFQEDTRSLGLKYDFAKSKNLAGVGIWALGFDDGKQELWSLLREKFGQKIAVSSLITRAIGGGFYD